MKTIAFFSFFVFPSLFLHAQDNFQLVAQRDGRDRIYRSGVAVKVSYRAAGDVASFKGRIAAVTADSIIFRPFRRSSDYRLSVAVTRLESVRKVRRTSRVIIGFVAAVATIHGIALIADDNKDHSEHFDGWEAGAGVALMMLGWTSYIGTAATEPVSKTSKGYRFMVERR